MTEDIPHVTLTEFLQSMSDAIGPIPVWIWYVVVIAVFCAVVRAIYPWRTR